jgi:hypothetical protein
LKSSSLFGVMVMKSFQIGAARACGVQSLLLRGD